MKKLTDTDRASFIDCVASHEDTLANISDIITSIEEEIEEKAAENKKMLFIYVQSKIGSPHQTLEEGMFWNFKINEIMYGLCVDEDGLQILCEDDTSEEDMLVALAEIKKHFQLETILEKEAETTQFVYSIEEFQKETRIMICREEFWEEHGYVNDYLEEEETILLQSMIEELQAEIVTETIFSSSKSLREVQNIINKYNYMIKSESFDEHNEVFI